MSRRRQSEGIIHCLQYYCTKKENTVQGNEGKWHMPSSEFSSFFATASTPAAARRTKFNNSKNTEATNNQR